MKKIWQRVFSPIILLALGITLFPVISQAAEYSTSGAVYCVFSSSSVTVDGSAQNNTALTINDTGTYIISGSCSDGSISVESGTTGVTLVLNGLTLASETTAPICCGKETEVTVIAASGTINNLSDSASTNEESAVIKSKSGSTLTFGGSGSLAVTANFSNGIKGAAETDIVIDTLTLIVTAANNAIASDNSVTVNSGKITIKADNDGLKSEPDEDDLVSSGNIVIYGGTFSINSTGDGMQASNTVTIYNGTFTITTGGGYTTTLGTDDSAKGIKGTNNLTIYDGTFSINSADDALHGNAYMYLLGGNFTIYSGDDGAHADTSLIIGEDSASVTPVINIKSSYEGLEGGTVYIYSGIINVVSSDDGINTAGGSSDTTTAVAIAATGDRFNPGGGGGTGPSNPGSIGSGATVPGTSSGNYNLYIYDGSVYINAGGDGLDANGSIYMYDGYVVVFGAVAGNDNSPLDYDGTFALTGGTLFAAGSSMMGQTPSSSSSSQSFVSFTQSISSGKAITIKNSSGTALFSVVTPKSVNYVVYSSASITGSGYTLSTGSAVDSSAIDLSDSGFPDVSSSSWYYTYVSELAESEIISGYSNGYFYPANTTKSGEALKLILLASGYDKQVATGTHWASGYLSFAISEGFVSENDITDLDAEISRELIAKIAAKALGLSYSGTSNPFSDTSSDYVLALYEADIVQGSVENGVTVFNPDSSIIRSEISAIIWRIQNTVN